MSQQNATNPSPEVIVGLEANLPNPVSISQGEFYYSSDTGNLRVSVIAPNGTRSWGGVGTVVSTAPVALFVNPVTGNDSNPGTSAAPLQTLQAALNRARMLLSTVSTTINLQNGTYNLGSNPVLSVPPVLSVSSPILIQGSLIDSGLGPIAATGGTATSQFVSPPIQGSITGAPAGAPVNGIGIWQAGSVGNTPGNRFVVQANTAGTIKVTVASVGGGASFHAPVAGDHYTVGTQGAILTWTGSLTFVGDLLLLDTVAFEISTSVPATLFGSNLQFLNDGVQSNACKYFGTAALFFAQIDIGIDFKSGSNFYQTYPHPICPDVFDGSALGVTPVGLFIISLESTRSFFVGSVFNNVGLSMSSTQSCVLRQVHTAVNSSFGTEETGSMAILSGLYTNMADGSFLGLGPGCISARVGGILDIGFTDIQASAAGLPVISLDQSHATLTRISGANPAATFVLELHKQSSADVSAITATDASAASHAQVGGNAAPTVISGAVPQTTDNAAVAPELCIVGAPT